MVFSFCYPFGGSFIAVTHAKILISFARVSRCEILRDSIADLNPGESCQLFGWCCRERVWYHKPDSHSLKHIIAHVASTKVGRDLTMLQLHSACAILHLGPIQYQGMCSVHQDSPSILAQVSFNALLRQQFQWDMSWTDGRTSVHTFSSCRPASRCWR